MSSSPDSQQFSGFFDHRDGESQPFGLDNESSSCGVSLLISDKVRRTALPYFFGRQFRRLFASPSSFFPVFPSDGGAFLSSSLVDLPA